MTIGPEPSQQMRCSQSAWASSTFFQSFIERASAGLHPVAARSFAASPTRCGMSAAHQLGVGLGNGADPEHIRHPEQQGPRDSSRAPRRRCRPRRPRLREQPDVRVHDILHAAADPAPAPGCRPSRRAPRCASRIAVAAANAGTTKRGSCPGPVCANERAMTTRNPARRHARVLPPPPPPYSPRTANRGATGALFVPGRSAPHPRPYTSPVDTTSTTGSARSTRRASASRWRGGAVPRGVHRPGHPRIGAAPPRPMIPPPNGRPHRREGRHTDAPRHRR